MKKLLFIFLLGFASILFSQERQGITYQALIIDPSGEFLPGADNNYSPLKNISVCLQFHIIDSTNSYEYSEQHTVTTDNFGMVNLVIGTGSAIGGVGWENVSWSASAKSLKVDIDKTGSCSSFEELSNQPLTSVPFALYSPGSDLPGPQGDPGEAGLSAYEVWLDLGNTGTEQDFIDSLKGPDGDPGDPGSDGDSAYDIWISAGNTGTEQDFLNSLKGSDGKDFETGFPNGTNIGDKIQWTWDGNSWQVNVVPADNLIGVTNFQNISDLQNNLNPDSQVFIIDDTSSPFTISGANGTNINIQGSSIMSLDGNLYSGNVTATLKEFLTPNEMIKSGIQTSSNGQILVTGGSFEFNLKGENDEELMLSSWTTNAAMPINVELSNKFMNNMMYYSGERIVIDGREQVNWNLTQGNEFSAVEGFANFYGINVGLANCDVLFSSVVTGLGTQFSVLLDGVSDYSNSIVWMYINDFPSVIQITSLLANNEGFKTYDDSIPIGLNASLLGIFIDEDGYLKFGTLDIQVQGDDIFTIPLDYGTIDDLKIIIENL
jgi:hypothetical protein